MGLDQYAYVAARVGQRTEYWDGAELDEYGKYVNTEVSEPRELAYWRKHPNLQGWMEQLWIRKGCPGVDLKNYAPDQDPDFNGIELELTWEDLEELEQAIKKHQLPQTLGFFFGNNSDQHYYGHDLDFINRAKAELFSGLKVFYNSSW
jgi:hypothetical protein